MIYIFGHRKPDTDSICASITLSYLKNKLGQNTIPASLGDLNNETAFVLKKFNIPVPKYLNDVKLQIKNICYKKGCYIDQYKTIMDGYNYMTENHISGVPIIDETKKLIGLVTIKELAKELIEGDHKIINTSYANIIRTLNAKEILKFDDEIQGNVLVSSYRSTTFLENIKLNSDSILIVGDRQSILEYAINSKVKLIIVLRDNISDEHIKMARKNKVNIIQTNCGTYDTTRLITLSNYIKNVIFTHEPVTFDETDYYSQFVDISNKLKHTNYPVVNKKNVCLGLLPVTLSTHKNPKQVILVDHNEKEQSVDGLEEALILEIVDHHKLGTVATTLPINFRNMSVGSTNTIIYGLYKENKVKIPKDMAGLMLAGIISDTLMLKSPTTTSYDKTAVLELEKIAKIDYKTFGLEMFKAGSSLNGKTIDEIIYQDFKKFTYNDKDIGVSQVTTVDIEYIIKEKEKYIESLNKLAMSYDIVALFITDIIKNGSYVLFSDKSQEILRDSFNLNDLKQGHYFNGIVSRKKQIIPPILEALERK